MPIHQVAAGLERVLSLDAQVEELAGGFGGSEGPAEGPLWWKEGGYLLFSDLHNDRRMKWTPGGGTTIDSEPADYGNGLTRDRQGRLVICHHTRKVTRIEQDGSTTVVANKYRGMRLNRPNDVVVKSDGAIYFTDPITRNVESEIDIMGVYRVSPDLGIINLLVRDVFFPNGLAFSPDEKVLYINDTRQRHIRAFQVEPTGSLDPDSGHILCELKGEQAGSPDGMKVDLEGNIYCTGPGGIWIMAPSGQHLGTITVNERVTNVGWGGDDWKTLFFTTANSLGCIQLKIPGVPVPRGEVQI